MIRIDVELPLSGMTLDVHLSLQGPVTALFGPSGAGKTSLLETVAGLRAPRRAEISIDSRVLHSSSRAIALRPEARGVGYVPQDVLLFPHLSVRRNILYGVRHDTPAMDFESIADALDIVSLLDRDTRRISGGERQRVALARALMTRPSLLLLDEPMAALDVTLKDRVLPYLRGVVDAFGIPAVFVTHDATDVLGFCDETVVLEAGRVVAAGRPSDLLTSRRGLQPLFDGSFENVLSGHLEGHERSEGTTRLRTRGGLTLWIPLQHDPPGTEVRAGVRAEDILVARAAPDGISARNVLQGRIESIEESGAVAMLRVSTPEPLFARLTRGAVRQLQLDAGQPVALIIKTHSVHRLG